MYLWLFYNNGKIELRQTKNNRLVKKRSFAVAIKKNYFKQLKQKIICANPGYTWKQFFSTV